jgi:hypothetical protein
MLFAKDLLANREGALQVGLGGSIVALVHEQQAQVVEA